MASLKRSRPKAYLHRQRSGGVNLRSSKGIARVDRDVIGRDQRKDRKNKKFEHVEVYIENIEKLTLGVIEAGPPKSAYPLVDTNDMKSKEGHIIKLEVRGNSMIDAGIKDGDIIEVRVQWTAQNGDIVSAYLRDRDGMTLKRYFFDEKSGQVVLKPANSEMQPIIVNPEDVEIQGVVVRP